MVMYSTIIGIIYLKEFSINFQLLLNLTNKYCHNPITRTIILENIKIRYVIIYNEIEIGEIQYQLALSNLK